MKFYTVENLKDGSNINSNSIDISLMTKVFKILDKKSENKTVDSLINFNFIFLENGYKFSNTENLIFHHCEKSLNFALVNENTIFQIENKDQSFYLSIHEGVLKSKIEKTSLENIIKTNSVKSVNSIEEKALNWLNTGRVGLSSATMCATLFPNLLKHHKLSDKIEINWPHDNSDFGRCMKFLEDVPEARERLGELKKLSKEWNALVENWDNIENLIKENKTEDSQLLIKNCLNRKKIKP